MRKGRECECEVVELSVKTESERVYEENLEFRECMYVYVRVSEFESEQTNIVEERRPQLFVFHAKELKTQRQ